MLEFRDRVSRRRRRLNYTIEVDERLSCNGVRVGWRFGHAEDGCKANIGPFQQRTPFIPGLGAKDRAELGTHLRPRIPAHLLLEYRVLVESDPTQQFAVELRFD